MTDHTSFVSKQVVSERAHRPRTSKQEVSKAAHETSVNGAGEVSGAVHDIRGPYYAAACISPQLWLDRTRQAPYLAMLIVWGYSGLGHAGLSGNDVSDKRNLPMASMGGDWSCSSACWTNVLLLSLSPEQRPWPPRCYSAPVDAGESPNTHTGTRQSVIAVSRTGRRVFIEPS